MFSHLYKLKPNSMKKNLLLIFALILGIAFSSSAFAQNEGYNRIGLSYESIGVAGSESSIHWLDGASVSYARGIALTQSCPLYLEVGGVLDAAFAEDSGATDIHMALQVPVNMTYAFSLGDIVTISPFAGINVKATYLLMGTDGDNTIDYLDSDAMGGSAFNAINVGWQAGVNIDISKFYVGVSYGSDFTESITDSKSHFTRLAVTVGVKF